MSKPRELNMGDFDEKGRLSKDLGRGIVVVMFYSDGCGHCIAAKPAYKEFAANSGGMKVAWIDYQKAQNQTVGMVKNKWPFEIKGYPTFVIFVNGVAEGYYEGPRTASGFKSIAGKLNV